jgi:hypothetical protein
MQSWSLARDVELDGGRGALGLNQPVRHERMSRCSRLNVNALQTSYIKEII